MRKGFVVVIRRCLRRGVAPHRLSPMSTTERFRTAMRRERERQGLSLAALGRRMDVKYQMLSELEKTGAATLKTVQKVADALNVDPSVLLEAQ